MPSMYADPSSNRTENPAAAIQIIPPVSQDAMPNAVQGKEGVQIGGGEPPSDDGFLSKIENAFGSLDHPSAKTDESGDPATITAPQAYHEFTGSNIAVPAFTDSQSTNIGQSLDQFTQAHENVRYDFGSKNLASGGIDCSGWVATNTLQAMNQMNKVSGKPIYDVQKMQGVLNQGAAYQIDSIGKMSGFASESDIRSGRVVNGMLIGVQRKEIPTWAADRPMGISHIGQVVVRPDGSKWISESSGSGVKLTPYDQWINKPTVNRLYGVNPFHILSTTYMATQK